jgi:hypothetical protein
MQEAAMSLLAPWESFYVIVGSSAAVLTGLVFVVITLIAENRERSSREATAAGVAAFSTPTVVHFCVVLFSSVLLSAPWPALAPVRLLLGLAGLGGLGYALIALRRLRRQPRYRPVLEDWLWYGVVPLVAYAVLVGAAVLLAGRPTPALFSVGAALVLLLFLGIRNAWDVCTYLTLARLAPPHDRQD